MILYYAPGGGLGHLTRGRRVLQTLGLANEAAFLTPSRYASDLRVTGGIPVVAMPATLEGDRDAHRAWVREAVAGADRLIADTFPAGIQGELEDLDVRMELVARSLRWDTYRREVPSPLPRFETIWSIEPLEPEHEKALRAQASSWQPLDLRTATASERLCTRSRQFAVGSRQEHPPPHGGSSSCLLPADCRLLVQSPSEPDRGDLLSRQPTTANRQPHWLLVHSGPEEEVRELMAHAAELRRIERSSERVLVATQCELPLPDGFELIDAYPVTHLLAGATRILSAAGFNVMLETEHHRHKHHPLPFARRYDDQYARAARRRVLMGDPVA